MFEHVLAPVDPYTLGVTWKKGILNINHWVMNSDETKERMYTPHAACKTK